MDGEVVDTLLRLLDEGIAIDLPAEVVGLAVDLLQCLVEGDGTDGHGAIADDPLARLVDVTPSGEIHHGVGTPAGSPYGLLHLLSDATGDGRVADIGIDLAEEVAPDDHGFELGVVDVGWDDGAPSGDLFTDKFWGHVWGDLCTQRVTCHGVALLGLVDELVLTYRHVLHLLGDDTLAGIVALGDTVLLRYPRVEGDVTVAQAVKGALLEA
jgi:hypothetical protein